MINNEQSIISTAEHFAKFANQISKIIFYGSFAMLPLAVIGIVATSPIIK